MMFKKIYTVVVLLLITMCIHAQREQNNWFFGRNAGLTWQTTTSYSATGVYGTANATLTNIPTALTGSPLSTKEGCFSISDVDGNLLFFSDGMTIWNKNKSVMTNGTGMAGHNSSTQSGIIFPYPNSNTRYIAVSLGEGNANNLSYSIIDMSQSGGLGAVEAANKNILLTGQSGVLGESVAAVRHTNRNDFWIVAPGRGTTSYLNVWKVTETGGVQQTRHNVATVAAASISTYPGGYIKFTSDGLHFVWIDFFSKFFSYGDFNPTTGTISNVRVRTGTLTSGTTYGYGVEFTPDGKYLYLTYAPSDENINTITGLQVFDFEVLLATSTPNLINPIKTIVNPTSLGNGINNHFGAIQAGPDGRMYIPHFGSKGMFVITNPEDPLNLKIYKISNILTGTALWGLPNFAAPWFRMVIDPPTNTEVCAETTAAYKLEVINGMGFNNVARIVLDFGDGTPSSRVTFLTPSLGTYTQTYRYKKPGTYTITATAYNSNGGVELMTTSVIKVNTCVLRVNPHIRGVNQ